MGNKNSAFNAKLKAKEWQWQLKTECKHLDKEIKKIQAGEAKLQREIQAQAQKGNTESVQLLARSVVKSRKAVGRLERTKVSMHAVDLQLTTSIATMSTSSAIRLSADVMRKMNGIAKMPEVGEAMEQMRREMAKCAEADDSIEDALREDGEEEAAAVEVQRVLEEMALDQMGPLAAKAAAQPQAAPAAAAPAQPVRQLVAVGAPAEPALPAWQPPPAAQPAPMTAPLLSPEPAAEAKPPAAMPGFPPAAAPQPPQPPPQTAAASAAPASAEDDELMRRLQNLKG